MLELSNQTFLDKQNHPFVLRHTINESHPLNITHHFPVIHGDDYFTESLEHSTLYPLLLVNSQGFAVLVDKI